MSAPVAGWYTDPASPDNLRWWDGSTWTRHSQSTRTADAPTAGSTLTATTEESLIAAILAADALDLATPNAKDTGVIECLSIDQNDDRASEETPSVPSLPVDGAVPRADDGVPRTARAPLRVAVLKTRRSTIAAGAAVALMVGAFAAPWLRIGDSQWSIFDSHIPWIVTGGSWDGNAGVLSHGPVYAALICLALAGLTGRIPKPRWAAVGSGSAILALTVANYLRIDEVTSLVSDTPAEAGPGLYLMLTGSLAVIGSTLQASDHHGN